MRRLLYSGLHFALLALALSSWVVAGGGLLYAELFISKAVGPTDVMSRHTATSLMVVGVAWLTAAAALALSLLLIAIRSQRSRAVAASAIVAGLYVVPSLGFLIYLAIWH